MRLDLLITSWIPLLKGLMVTLELSVLVLGIGTIGGFLLGLLHTMKSRLISIPILAFVFLSRGVPLLVQIFFVYLVLPLYGVLFSAFFSALLALSLFAVATISEIIRGAIEAVPNGQILAGKALGMQRWQINAYVILPQAFRSILPPLVAQFVLLIKATSLVSLVGVTELMQTGREIIEREVSGFEVMLLVMFIYTIVCWPLSSLAYHLQVRIEQKS